MVFGLLLNKTTFGRNTLAIGGNEEAARLAGVPVVRTKIIIFVLSGLVSAASPGSIIAILGMCAKDSYIGVILSVIVAAAVSFVIAAFILKFSNKNTDDNALEEASAAVSSM